VVFSCAQRLHSKVHGMEQIGTVRPSDMPIQEEFKNLIVEPADIHPQSCNWESSKRVEVHLTKQGLKLQADDRIKLGALGRRDDSDSCATPIPADSNSLDTPKSLDDECTIFTFVIGATYMWDPSKPMPPPRRFVRKGVPQQ
jgi:hypothetical protein